MPDPLGWGALAALVVAVAGASLLRGGMRLLVTAAGATAFLLLAVLLGTQAIDDRASTAQTKGAVAPALDAARTALEDGSRAAMFLEAAARALAENRVDDARRAYGEADALFQRAGDLRGRARVALGRGAMEASLGQPDGARTAYAAARDLYRRAGDSAGETIAWVAMGDLERTTQRHGAARTAYREARDAYERAAGYVASDHVLLGLEQEARAPNGVDLARARLAAARALYEQIEDLSGVGLTSLILGQLEEAFGNTQQALVAYEDAATRYRAADDPPGLTEALVRGGLVEATHGYADSARAALTEAIVVAAGHGDRPGLAIALLVIGRLERIVGNYDASRDSLLNAVALAAELGDPLLGAEATLGVADADRLAGRGADAKGAYERAVQAFARGKPADAGPAIFGLATMQGALGEAEAAAAAFGAAATLFNATGDDRGEAMALIGRGHARLALAKYADALEDFRAAFDPLIRLDSALGDALAQSGVSLAKQSMGDTQGAAEARQYAADALAAARDPVLEANRMLGLGTFGAFQFRSVGEVRAEAFAREFPRANAEALALVQSVRDFLAAAPR
ncbi:MAG: tetratricopeptide repeat protein [Alphaproteobacteria bacterium]|nr:tetratricopeptide repeat protein [Alphaproteobacteria bacterium]